MTKNFSDCKVPVNMLYYFSNTHELERIVIRKLALLVGVASLGLATSSIAQETAEAETPHLFISAISDNTLELSHGADGELSGNAWDRLQDEAAQAQFFLIGETHATADVANLAIAMHRALAPQGYEHMVIEVGPWSTRHTEDLIRSGNGKLGEFIAAPGNGFTLPFLFFTEEIALVEQAVSLSTHDDNVLWGVDQEFLAAGPILAAKLHQLATSAAEHAAAAQLEAKSSEQMMYLGSAPQEEIDALVAAFADGTAEARELVDAIALTNRIYGPFVKRSGPIYYANLERENYMKTNFLEHFAAAEERLGHPPKAFFKFGGFHLERGLSGTNVPSFGNFVMEWGRARDFGTVHVMIDCIDGQAWGVQQSAPVPCTPYALAEGSPILAALEGKDMAMVDLKALRPLLRSSTPIDAKTRDLILSYDYYIALRDVQPATPAADLGFPGQ